VIPRIQTGTSFKDAGLYYLHDKRLEGELERLTTERVAWTHARNTLESEPEAVIREMQHTAMSQQSLKYLSGNRTDGRPTERTVMTVSLAWHPEQQPTRKHMLETAESFLAGMRFHEHQVLMVGHDDTKHPHIHLIINRIHPDTGLTIDDKWYKTRAQKWALGYEREHGHIYCHAREARYDRDRGSNAGHTSYREWQTYQEFTKDKAVDPEFQQAMRAGEWDALRSGQRDDRLGFWKETGQMRKQVWSALRDDVRFEFAGEWKAYAQAKEESDRKAGLYDREARRAIRELRKQGGTKRTTVELVKGPDGRSYRKRRSIESDGIEQIKARRKAYHERQRAELWEMRSAISERQKECLGSLADIAFARLSADRAEQYQDVLAAHRGERRELGKDQRSGERRRDVLQRGDHGSSGALTPEQIASYTAEARKLAAREPDQQKFRRALSAADRAGDAGRDPRDQQLRPEAHQRSKEKKDKDQTQEAKRQSDVGWYLAKRAHDRARDRGGGRDR
jgi:hypothetical protein